MSEWWTYRAEDFLLFSPRVYWRMFELHNAALWPLHVLTLAAGLIIILLVARRPKPSARWLALILAMLWIFRHPAHHVHHAAGLERGDPDEAGAGERTRRVAEQRVAAGAGALTL